jgi:hypothetical protein
VTDDQEVYNTKGKSPGSSGNNATSDDGSRQSHGIPPLNPNATNDTFDTLKQESEVHIQRTSSPPPNTVQMISGYSQTKVYSYAMDQFYRRKLNMYRRSLKSRLQTLANKTNP